MASVAPTSRYADLIRSIPRNVGSTAPWAVSDSDKTGDVGTATQPRSAVTITDLGGPYGPVYSPDGGPYSTVPTPYTGFGNDWVDIPQTPTGLGPSYGPPNTASFIQNAFDQYLNSRGQSEEAKAARDEFDRAMAALDLDKARTVEDYTKAVSRLEEERRRYIEDHGIDSEQIQLQIQRAQEDYQFQLEQLQAAEERVELQARRQLQQLNDLKASEADLARRLGVSAEIVADFYGQASQAVADINVTSDQPFVDAQSAIREVLAGGGEAVAEGVSGREAQALIEEFTQGVGLVGGIAEAAGDAEKATAEAAKTALGAQTESDRTLGLFSNMLRDREVSSIFDQNREQGNQALEGLAFQFEDIDTERERTETTFSRTMQDLRQAHELNQISGERAAVDYQNALNDLSDSVLRALEDYGINADTMSGSFADVMRQLEDDGMTAGRFAIDAVYGYLESTNPGLKDEQYALMLDQFQGFQEDYGIYSAQEFQDFLNSDTYQMYGSQYLEQFPTLNSFGSLFEIWDEGYDAWNTISTIPLVTQGPGSPIGFDFTPDVLPADNWYSNGYSGQNGQIPMDDLTQVGVDPSGRPQYLVGGAASAYLQMVQAALEDGVTIGFSTGGAYRSYGEQVSMIEDVGPYIPGQGGAAEPGTSNHGWGVAADLSTAGGTNDAYKWLTENAWQFGFDQPMADEPHHWEWGGGGSAVTGSTAALVPSSTPTIPAIVDPEDIGLTTSGGGGR